MMYAQTRPTVRFVAHVVDKLGVRGEWLLTGAGPMLAATPHNDSALRLPYALTSVFKTFDTIDHSVTVLAERDLAHDFLTNYPVQDDPQSVVRAACAVYRAQAAQKRVGFFLGASGCSAEFLVVVRELFARRIFDVLGLTLTAVSRGIPQSAIASGADLNAIAKMAAETGAGYGEVFCRIAAPLAVHSAAALAKDVAEQSNPVVFAADIGELTAHTAPGLRGAELGAAVGAAAYTDLLILTEQLRDVVGNPSGVFLIAGEAMRIVRLILQRLEALRHAVPDVTACTFVIFSSRDEDVARFVENRGGRVLFVGPPNASVGAAFLRACDDVYAGKITYEQE